MAPRKRTQFEAILRERSPAFIDAAVYDDLERRLAPISGSYLRQLLRKTGLPLAPLIEGVNQRSFADLERTLLALAQEYEHSDASQRRQIRKVVIEGKNKLRWSLGKAPPEKKAVKQEMLLWTMTWLENPAVFPTWLTLRRRSATVDDPGPPTG